MLEAQLTHCGNQQKASIVLVAVIPSVWLFQFPCRATLPYSNLLPSVVAMVAQWLQRCITCESYCLQLLIVK